jgi:hypothetical protein
MDKPLVNRVAKSGILTLNLQDFYPDVEIVVFDVKDYLFKELILRENDFRTAVDAYDWPSLQGKHLVVTCSSDAIIPMWAYMLVAVSATNHAISVFTGTVEQFLSLNMIDSIDAGWNDENYRDKRVILKGCSDKSVPPGVYLHMSARLQPLVKSIMYGEPCSTVPIYKAPKSNIAPKP